MHASQMNKQDKHVHCNKCFMPTCSHLASTTPQAHAAQKAFDKTAKIIFLVTAKHVCRPSPYGHARKIFSVDAASRRNISFQLPCLEFTNQIHKHPTILTSCLSKKLIRCFFFSSFRLIGLLAASGSQGLLSKIASLVVRPSAVYKSQAFGFQVSKQDFQAFSF